MNNQHVNKTQPAANSTENVKGAVTGMAAQPAAVNATCYVIDPAQWGIKTDGTEAVKTTEGLNKAIAHAKSAGYNEAFIPKGTYLIQGVGTTFPNTPEKGGGIVVPSHMKLTLDHEAELKVQPNAERGYSCIYLRKVQNVTISGGIITGDLDQHDFSKLPKSTYEWGFGIYVHGGKNITIENMKIRKCIGDCIFLGSVGLLGVDPDYDKPEKVAIRNCSLDGARRNNISITAADGVFVENNVITNAGTVKGTKPWAGIDIEGYGEGAIDYEEPRRVVVRGNVFRGNAEVSVLNFNGYGVIIEGNHADNTFSYGNGTDTVISNNVMVRTDGSKVAIAAQQVSNGYDGNNVTIVGNIIKGFSSGIDARGKDVVVTGNTVSHLGNTGGTGIGVWDAENVLVADNAVHRCAGLPYKVDNSNDVQFLNNKALHSERFGLELDKSTNVVLRGNSFGQCNGGISIKNWGTKGTSVFAEGNYIDCASYTGKQTNNYAISFDKNSDVTLKENYIFGSRSVAIYGESSAGKIVKIADNEISDITGNSAIQIKGGQRAEIVGNRITFKRKDDAAYGISLADNAEDAIIAQNTIYSNNGKSIPNAIVTESSKRTKVLNNLLINGKMLLNKDDTNIGNTIV
ncbi:MULTISPECIES: right-handed parallel beta-helix repeat-containing protein [Paenibacillus]|uniref:Right handed beta helix region family protein n=1 Tax=Paenibacillus macerans TaxID=44252 RepID=A0A090ZKM7_PAEMA|nr:right-handed parallel beta-helix repeat-containing protein [Paenibacillus macerans]KFN11157.1 right handed beta helix region family protein [Paenibacillus macerans]MCY7560283.1 right-handed parallel beta-helix repeat-containing protein [Paenibacillus macerans]MEC0151337.1 right-handed parallel beta-helix repeat-containing protein [Paenibacillus macerans]MEC0328818.1 right-handed parallel beta-helix repeat-containing protein [Paenibacillus macerans]SUD26758.1 Pectate lyase superfamily protei